MGYSKEEQQKLKQRIKTVLEEQHINTDALMGKPMEELLQEVSIYHQELEYQNMELMRVQEELERSRNHFISLFEEAPVAYLVLDQEHQITAVNQSLCNLVKASREELIQSPFEKWLAPESQDQIYFHFKALKQGVPQEALQVTLRSNQDQDMTVKLQSKLLQEKDTLEIRLSLVDITQEKMLADSLQERSRFLEDARQQAELANKAKNQFLSNVSHELRTPMNAIDGFLQLIIGTEINKEQEEYLNHSMHASRRMLRLVTQLLDYASLESEELSLQPQEMVFMEFLHSFMISWKNEAMDNGLEFVVQTGDNLPQVIQTDGVKLRQILDHLMENALKFTSEGEIDLEVDLAGEEQGLAWIAFRFTDTGIGINGENLERIFDLFNQEDNSNTRSYGGLGIGLTIVKRLSEKMGGRIKVYSEVGKGSTFEAVLPFPVVSYEDVG